jgi:hypothetical protein
LLVTQFDGDGSQSAIGRPLRTFIPVKAHAKNKDAIRKSLAAGMGTCKAARAASALVNEADESGFLPRIGKHRDVLLLIVNCTRFSIYDRGVKLVNQISGLFGLPLIASLLRERPPHVRRSGQNCPGHPCDYATAATLIGRWTRPTHLANWSPLRALGLSRIVFAIRIGIVAPWEAAGLAINRAQKLQECLAMRGLRIHRRLNRLTSGAILHHRNSPEPVAVSTLLAVTDGNQLPAVRVALSTVCFNNVGQRLRPAARIA